MTVRKKALLPLLAAALTVAFAASSARAETLRFVTEELPPFSFEKNGKAGGPLAEIVAEACKALELSCPIQVLPWRRSLALAEAGDAEGIFTVLTTSAERRQKFFVMPALIHAEYSFFANEKSDFIYQKPADIRNVRVIAYGPSGTSITLEGLVRQSGGSQPVEVEVSNLMALKKLAADRYDGGVVLMNRDVASYILRSEKLPGIKMVGDAVPLEYSIGLSRKSVSEGLAMRFAAALNRLKETGRVKLILAAYDMRPAY
ncbi:MAG TPA: transporter substrate-binding domain-containing protein [Candidatus Sulfotelmatobacter sp.]|jgi:polar amino acid transport system substrate-binding protein|nr:transporter substrate-binding domain-containing protein [Candidatus Sulfotelmatobacter sp.]